MKTRVTVLAVERKEFPSRQAGGKSSVLYICQCVVHGEKVEVGVLRVPEKLAAEGVMPGDYMAEFGLNVHWETKNLEGRLVALDRVGAVTMPGSSNPSPVKADEKKAA